MDCNGIFVLFNWEWNWTRVNKAASINRFIGSFFNADAYDSKSMFSIISACFWRIVQGSSAVIGRVTVSKSCFMNLPRIYHIGVALWFNGSMKGNLSRRFSSVINSRTPPSPSPCIALSSSSFNISEDPTPERWLKSLMIYSSSSSSLLLPISNWSVGSYKFALWLNVILLFDR